MLLRSKFKQLFIVIFSLLIVAGCVSSSVKDDDPAVLLEAAKQFSNVGNYTAAAEEYLKLSRQVGRQSDGKYPSALKQSYQIRAAEAYIKAGDSLSARKISVQIDRLSLDSLLLLRHDIVRARAAEIDQQPDQVISSLRQVDYSAGTRAMQEDVLRMRIAAFEVLESPLGVARSLSRLDMLLDSQEAIDENRRAIWTMVDQLDIDTLAQWKNDPQDPLTGWVRLALIAKISLFDIAEFNKKIDQWRLSYPDHPAENPILTDLFAKNKLLGHKVTSIALLLPQNGRFAQAGAAVRDGFLSAWYSENDQTEQPMVHIYDADADNIIDAYQRAVEEGADLIVGPLEKSTLKTLLTLQELPVRTLALNQLSDEELSQSAEHIASDRFYQFGLSPEKEAGQVAERAWAEGYSHALAITPDSAWGDRLFNAFKEKYEELGGVILEHQLFAPATTNYSGAVTQLLNVDDSKQRFKALTKEVNRKIKFEPRPRQDVDFIFMAASPVQARQIRPQLLFHRASGVPVISTSHVFGLPPRGEPDLDLEGVIIGDMPWMIANQEIDPEAPLSMQQNWPDNNAAFLRLFALGIDAYKIIPQLGRLRLQAGKYGESFAGETGDLSMDENAQIQRELSWAKFSQGKPQKIKKTLIPSKLIQ